MKDKSQEILKLRADLNSLRDENTQLADTQQRYEQAQREADALRKKLDDSALDKANAEERHKIFTMALIVRKWNTIKVRSSFRLWKAHMNRANARKDVLRSALNRLANSTLSAAFNTWRQSVLYKLRSRNLVQRAIARIQNMQLHKAFGCWMLHLSTQRKMLRVVSRLSQQRACQVFASWQTAVAEARTEREKQNWADTKLWMDAEIESNKMKAAQQLMSRWRHRIVFKAVQRW